MKGGVSIYMHALMKKNDKKSQQQRNALAYDNLRLKKTYLWFQWAGKAFHEACNQLGGHTRSVALIFSKG